MPRMASKAGWIRTRASPTLAARYSKAAESAGISLSEWVRRACDDALAGRAHDMPDDPEFLQALDRIRAHLRQADDAPALRYAVLVAAELLDDPAGGTPVKP